MKVLMTTDAVGGVLTYSFELSKALAPFGVQVTLACLGPAANERQQAQAASIPNLTLVHGDYPLEWMDNGNAARDRCSDWLLSLEAAEQPDIVHVNGFRDAALPWKAPVLVVAHSSVVSWWEAVHNSEIPAVWDTYRANVGTGLRAADLVVAPTRAARESLVRQFAFDTRSVVIPNGIDSSEFERASKVDMIVCSGRVWDAAKNIGAVARVAQRVPWPVLVAGPLTAPEGNRAELASVVCLGELSQADLRKLLGATKIYAAPALYEPFGLGVLEAALSGCALVLGDIDSLRENWQDAALFVSPADDNALADVLDNLTTDRALCAAMGERARERAASFSAARMARSYLTHYRALIHSSPRGKVAPCA